MDLSKFTQRFREDLLAAAALGDERTQQLAAALAKSAEPAVRLILMSALSEFATRISAEFDDRTIEVRIDGDNLDFAVIHDAQTAADGANLPPRDPVADFEQALDDLGGNISRVTLRLVDNIKARAEEAANANGVSLNSWVSQAVRGALRDQGRWSWEPPHSRSRTSASATASSTAGATATDANQSPHPPQESAATGAEQAETSKPSPDQETTDSAGSGDTPRETE